jgi:hypothetical protein
MNPFLVLLTPLALLVPALAAVPPAEPGAPVEAVADDSVQQRDPAEAPTAAQVRIEQRVVIRIAPPGPRQRLSLVPDAAPLSPPRMKEKKMGKCVAVAGIAAVQPDAGGKLLLFMRDRRLVSASLEKACSARDFYSGFYLERSRDGMLCADRDKLHSRAGANCQISRMRQLVARDD